MKLLQEDINMETAELEGQVYEALVTNETLMGMLPNDGNVPVYHHLAPAGDINRYPILVYTPISDTPVAFGDNLEFMHKVRIRISIVTSDGQYSEINRIIRQIMTQDLEFKRINTVPVADFEYRKIILNADYEKIIPA